jgi:hypothetical protein
LNSYFPTEIKIKITSFTIIQRIIKKVKKIKRFFVLKKRKEKLKMIEKFRLYKDI